jgi:MoaA/NifB/PqqE/SkfB family radical SAM enzyme
MSGARKLALLRGYLAGRPLWCAWQLTRRCDSFCQFCEHRLEGGDPDPDLDECLRVVAALDRAGSLVVSLTGGDPLLRPDLPQIVAALARRHFPLLTTHGFLLSRDRARALWQAGLEGASVMLHHADAARHDAAAGLPGAHARSLQALESLAAERTRATQQVNVKARLDTADVEALEALLGLAARLGATVTVEPGFPLPRSEPPSPELGARLLELKRRHPHLRSSAWFLGRIPQALREGVAGCAAGRAFLNVDHRGRVSQCIEFTRPEDRAGDLRTEGLDVVLPRLRERHARNACRACFYSSRGEVEALYTVRGLVGGLSTLVRA